MAGVTREQIAQAREMTAIEYLQRYMPHELVRCGSNEFQLQSHDSFKINAQTSLFHWKSMDIGGKTALDYLHRVEGVPFVDAVRTLADERAVYIPRPKADVPSKAFILPERAPDNARVCAYLASRGISEMVMRYCVDSGIVYEDMPYHNAVFLGLDRTGKARFAAKRGTWLDKPYKRDVAGSEKAFGFYMQLTHKSHTVMIYESAIDAMSHASILEQDGRAWRDCYRLAVGGIYAPEEGKESKAPRQGKPPAALKQFLSDHPHIRRIEVCLDNDFAGRYAARKIVAHYCNRYEVENNPPGIQGDYNDLAVAYMQAKQEERRQKVRLSRAAYVR